MGTDPISFNMAAEGTVLHCPARILLGKKEGELLCRGTLQWGKNKLSHALEIMEDKAADQLSGYVDDLLPEKLPGELTFYYTKDQMMLGVQDSDVIFKVVKAKDGTAVLFVFQIQEGAKANSDTSALLNALQIAADFFGIQQFLFYAQTANHWMFPHLAENSFAKNQVPADIQACRFLTCAHIAMEGDSVFVKAVRTLFGLRETDLYVGGGDKEFLCAIRIPSFDTGFMTGSDMYMMMELGSKPAFIIKGSFVFSLVPDIKFTVDCRVCENVFELEAYAHVEKPVPLFYVFSIGDSCLMIRVSTDLTLGMYTNLRIGEIRAFGALILRVQGSSVVPDLLSAAVSDLSIPILLHNLLGTDLSGIEALDFIQIKGLPFQNLSPFALSVVENREIDKIISQFNSEIKDSSLQMDVSQVQVTPFEGGLDVTDLQRMRHYCIDHSGKMKLMAQFYYATENTKLGNYTVERGLFICAVIEIFGKAFEVLFSFREGEGLLAYAKIPAIDLGFLKIGPSEFSRRSESVLPVAKNSVLSQFIPPQSDGLVFFLSATKREISFYFDGMVDFLNLFHVDARIIYCQRMVSVDLKTVLAKTLQVSLHLKANYNSFTSGGFEFCLLVDTAPLTEKLTAVTKNIDNAIGKLREKINDAKREIDRAQAHVNELDRQIDSFNEKINRCKQEISNAGFWKKAFVAIAKGIEIGAYEVAKAGVYAAIGVATAALQVAKEVVNLSGKVSEGVMNAVNGVIQGAMNLFYINYLKLSAWANSAGGNFRAEIQFVALGKTYHLTTDIPKTQLESSPENAFSRVINDNLQSDLNNIENGSFRSNWQRYRHENFTVEQHCKRLDQVKPHLDSSMTMMTRMQDIYIDEFGTPMEEFDEMNVSLGDALGHVENALNTGVQAGNVSKLAHSMGGLKSQITIQEKKGVFRDEELAETKKVIAGYDEARLFYDKVKSGVSDVKKYRQKMEIHQKQMQDRTSTACGKCVMNGTEGDMASVLSQVEQQMYENFPVDRSGENFINLSREPLIQQCFAEAEKELGVVPSDQVQKMRSRSRKGNYKSRL